MPSIVTFRSLRGMLIFRAAALAFVVAFTIVEMRRIGGR
jgi:hypothetical protein